MGTRHKILMKLVQLKILLRHTSTTAVKEESGKTGLVLGTYVDDEGKYKLTKSAEKFDKLVQGKITDLLEGSKIKKGTCRVFHNLDNFYGVALTGLGCEDCGVDVNECLDRCKENIRRATAVGALALQEQSVENIMVEEVTNAEAAAEGAILGLWKFQEFVTEDEDREVQPKVILYDKANANADLWSRGVIKAQAQNIARRLTDLPANVLTPKMLAAAALDYLCPCGITVVVRDRKWIHKQRMFAFLSMAQASCESPYFVEMAYCGTTPDERPILLAGLGNCFDSGGICLKQCEGMSEYRGTCSGAAIVIAVMKAIAQYKLPINVIGLLPLMENMIGGMSVKPGDVLLAKNEKTIKIENTDNEGRLCLADTLVYAEQFRPCMTTTIGAMTKNIRMALGASATGAFTLSDDVFDELKKAGVDTGDRVWRLPIWEHFAERNSMFMAADLHNTGYMGHSAGAEFCHAAAFLHSFAPKQSDFLHLDTTGTGLLTRGRTAPYYRKGFMTGRPTRTLIQFLRQLALPSEKK